MDGKSYAATSFLLFLIACPAMAQDRPRLVKDVNQQPWDLADPTPVAAGSFVPAGDRLVFSISDFADDGSLWTTDGTPQGTAPLAVSICPSPCQSITPMAAAHGIALLRAESGTELVDKTVRLWRTDGTAAGTAPLTAPFADIKATLADGSLPGPAVLYFVGCRTEEGCELWSSDGTNDGTRIVADLKPGPGGSNPHALTAWRGGLYFLADDGRGTGLWSTDGTAGAIVLVTPVQEGALEELLAATPSRLFFTVGANREELWATGGTAASTRRARAFERVRRCPNESGCPLIQSLDVFGGDLFFMTTDSAKRENQYWSSDGTAAGTRRWLGFPSPSDSGDVRRLAATLRRVGPRWVVIAPAGRRAQGLWASAASLDSASALTGCDGGCPAVISFVGAEAHSGGLLFIGADSAYGQELWITDGTAAGTRRLTDACPGPCSGFADGAEPSPGAFSRGTFVVATPDPDNQRELWATDGTPEGTQRIASLAAGVGSWGGLTFFGTLTGSPLRGEVWVTDGTAAGTRQVAVLEHTAPGSDPLLAAVRGGTVLLAREGRSQYVWGSDGTSAGTRRLSDVDLGSDLNAFVAGFFTAGELKFYEVGKILPGGWGEELWRTDGTPEGTRVAAQFTPFRTLRHAADWNGKLLFQMEGPAADECAWWTSDGTAAGTREILPFPHDVRCATGVMPFDSTFLFVARSGKARNFIPQLFLSDGTAAGTRQLSRFRGSRDELDPGFVRIGGTAFFLIVSRTGLDAELWRTDGTPQGTRQAAKLPQPSRLFGFGGALYLTAGIPGDPNGQLALWRLPLDARAPVLLHTLRYGPQPSYTPLGDRLLFVADADEHGVELWGTDGTAEGTALVSDILPGEGSSMPAGLTVAGGKVFFAAHDGEHGWEPWESDGTAAGTRMVQDVNPGPFSSAPSGFTLSGSNLFFAADDGTAGVEPWVLPLGPRTP